MKPENILFETKIKAPWQANDVRGLRASNKRLAEKAGLKKEAIWTLIYVADELVSNIVDHSKAQWLEYQLRTPQDGNVPVMVLRDNGDPFDPTDPLQIEPTSDRGLGLTMIIKMISRMRYRRDNKVNELYVEIALKEDKP